jgi:transcription initiation factor TFIIB
MMGLAMQNPAAQKEEPFRPNLNVTLICPECKDGSNIVEEFASGDMVCGNCGMFPRPVQPFASFL